jgi:hypothetical protein
MPAHALGRGGTGCGRGGRLVRRHFSSCSAERARRCFSRAWLGVAVLPIAREHAATRMWCVTQLVAAHQQFGFESSFQFVRRPVRTVGGEAASEERSVELLADIKATFDASGLDDITTKALIAALCADEERPWASYNKGKPISDRQVAKLLKQFPVLSEDIYPPEERHAKGYKNPVPRHL